MKLYERLNKKYPQITFEPVEEETIWQSNRFINLHYSAKIVHPCFDFYIVKNKTYFEVKEYFFKPNKNQDFVRIISKHKNEYKAFEIFLDRRSKFLKSLGKNKKENNIYRIFGLIITISLFFIVGYWCFVSFIIFEMLEFKNRRYNKKFISCQIKDLFWITIEGKDVP